MALEQIFQSEPMTQEEFMSSVLDLCEVEISKLPPIELPVTHHFIPGFYCRQIFMGAGALLTSKIHNTEHPFVITKGDVSVWTEETGTVRLKAPYTGITKPGTRRMLFIHEDTVWTTFHPRSQDETTVQQIEDRIIEPHINPMLEKQTELLGEPV